MQTNFLVQYRDGNLPKEVKEYLDNLQVAVKKLKSSKIFAYDLTDAEKKKINYALFEYLAGQRKELPNFKGMLPEQEIEDLENIIAALREAGMSFKLEDEKGMRRLEVSSGIFGILSILSAASLSVSFIVIPIFGPIATIVTLVSLIATLVSIGGSIETNFRLKLAIESNKTVSKIANEIGFDFTDILNNKLKISEAEIETKKKESVSPFDSLKKSIAVKDITKSNAELIVNAGYEGAGENTVDRAIFKVFNKDGSLEKAVKEAIEKLGHEPVVGDVMLTEVNSKKIIHTAPPSFENADPREAKTKLVDLYLNIFKQIRDAGVESAAIPLICAGNFGAPLEWALECFMIAYEQEPLNNIKLDFCFYGNVKTLDNKTISAKKAVDIAKKMIDERINDVNKIIDNAHDEEKNNGHSDLEFIENEDIENDNDDEENGFNDDDFEIDVKNIIPEPYYEDKKGITINKEQVVDILEKEYEKLLNEIKPYIDYEQMRYESILKLGRVVEAVKNNQAFNSYDFVATIDRLRNAIDDVDEKDFGDTAKIKQIALYLINKEIDDKTKLAQKAKSIYESGIQVGDLLSQDKNITILNPGYKGEVGNHPTVDSMVFDKLDLRKNGELQKEIKDKNIEAKFVENEKGSTVLNKIDFGSFKPTENNLADVYYNSFKVCDGKTKSIACPLVGDGSLSQDLNITTVSAVKGFKKFIDENPNSKLGIKYIIYEKDKDADKKSDAMKNEFKNLAAEYDKEISEAKNKLNEILNLEIIKSQTKETKIGSEMMIKKPTGKVFELIKNTSENKSLEDKEEKAKPSKNDPEK